MLLELLFVAQTHAVSLKPIPPAHIPMLSGDPTTPTCDQLKARLDTFTTNLASHSTAMGSYLANLGNTVRGWYGPLKKLEGTPQTIAAGTFDVLSTGSDDIDTLNGMASANFQYLQDDLASIVTAIANCTKTDRSDRR